MILASKKTIKDLLERHGILPSKKLGQHFLVDRGILRDIVAAAELSPEDVILEIGPGVGTLTQELALRAKKVIAVEKDEKLITILRETVREIPRLHNRASVNLIRDDVLKKDIFNYRFSVRGGYKVVANLPYYIVSPTIRLFLEAQLPPRLMVLMVQKEVAQRICAKPPKMNLLAVSVQFYAEPKIIRYVKKTSFWPQPKVDSAIIKITQSAKRKAQIDPARFFHVVKAGFSHPRKQLINNLSGGLRLDRRDAEKWLTENNIQPTQRAESLSVADWIRLAGALNKS